jgi:hypothetical protein
VTRNGTVTLSRNTPPTANATLLSTVNNVGAPVRVRVAGTDSDGTVSTLTMENQSGGVIARTTCDSSNCSATLSTTPNQSTWNQSRRAYDRQPYRASVRDDQGAVTTERLAVRVSIRGDANRDGVVNIFDAVIVGQHWQSRRGSAAYADGADLNNDGVVNIFDAVIVGQRWQQTAAES